MTQFTLNITTMLCYAFLRGRNLCKKKFVLNFLCDQRRIQRGFATGLPRMGSQILIPKKRDAEKKKTSKLSKFKF